jgi:hypothetical protein
VTSRFCVKNYSAPSLGYQNICTQKIAEKITYFGEGQNE